MERPKPAFRTVNQRYCNGAPPGTLGALVVPPSPSFGSCLLPDRTLEELSERALTQGAGVHEIAKYTSNIGMFTLSYGCAKGFMPTRLPGNELGRFGAALFRLGLFEQDADGVPLLARRATPHSQYPFRRGTPAGNASASWGDFKARPAEERPLTKYVATFSNDSARLLDTLRIEVPVVLDAAFCKLVGERFVELIYGCNVMDPRIASVQVFVEQNGSGVTSFYSEKAGQEFHIHISVITDPAACFPNTSVRRRFCNFGCTCLQGYQSGLLPTLNVQEHANDCEPRKNGAIDRSRGSVSTRQYAWPVAADGRLVDSPCGKLRNVLQYANIKAGKGAQEPLASFDFHNLASRVMSWNEYAATSTGAVIIPKGFQGRVNLLRAVEMSVHNDINAARMLDNAVRDSRLTSGERTAVTSAALTMMSATVHNPGGIKDLYSQFRALKRSRELFARSVLRRLVSDDGLLSAHVSTAVSEQPWAFGFRKSGLCMAEFFDAVQSGESHGGYSSLGPPFTEIAESLGAVLFPVLGLDSLGALWPQWPLIPLDSGPGALESPEGETTSW